MSETHATCAREGVSKVVGQFDPNISSRIWSPTSGYNLAAPFYDSWHWQEFWRRNEHANVLKYIPPGGKYADIGCGTGTYCRELSQLGMTFGVDPSREMLKIAQANLPASVELMLGSAQSLPLATSSVDLSLTARVLSHEENLSRAVDEIARVTKVGGLWVLTDVHAGHPYPCTRIPTPRGDVLIETFKRTPEEIESVASATGMFECVDTLVFHASDLSWLPDEIEFARIDKSGRKPVFFLQAFRRT